MILFFAFFFSALSYLFLSYDIETYTEHHFENEEFSHVPCLHIALM